MSAMTSSDQEVAQEFPAFMTTAEEMYQTYNRQHRLRMASVFSFFLLITVVILLIAGSFLNFIHGIFISNPIHAYLYIAIGLLLCGLFGFANRQARLQKLLWATGSVTSITIVGTCLLSLFSNYIVTTIHVNTQLGFAALTLSILAAGFLGTISWIIATVVFLNVFTALAVFIFLPTILQQPTLASIPLVVAIFIVQWVIGILMIIGQSNYLLTIRALCNAEIAYARAQQLDELKDQFISSVNHELRNPIMAMMNYVTILKQRHEVMSIERRTQAIESLEATGNRVIHLVGSILDVRQMAEHLEDFESAAVPIYSTLMTASTLLDPIEARLTERDLHVDVPQQLEIWGNDIYLQQILTNLLSNAVKYSIAGTPIAVKAHAVNSANQEHGNNDTATAMVEIVVRDYGFGIPPAQIPLLFNRFVRLPRDLTSRTIGNGLGLYLCKVLTEAMGGTIWVESSGIDGEGSAFHVVLPQQSLDQHADALLATQKRAVIAVPPRDQKKPRLDITTVFARFQGWGQKDSTPLT